MHELTNKSWLNLKYKSPDLVLDIHHQRNFVCSVTYVTRYHFIEIVHRNTGITLKVTDNSVD